MRAAGAGHELRAHELNAKLIKQAPSAPRVLLDADAAMKNALSIFSRLSLFSLFSMGKSVAGTLAAESIEKVLAEDSDDCGSIRR
jgi:hypothetical protein